MTTKVLLTISIVHSHFFYFENVFGIENKISVFNVLTTFGYCFSKYEASDLIPYQINSLTKYKFQTLQSESYAVFPLLMLLINSPTISL